MPRQELERTDSSSSSLELETTNVTNPLTPVEQAKKNLKNNIIKLTKRGEQTKVSLQAATKPLDVYKYILVMERELPRIPWYIRIFKRASIKASKQSLNAARNLLVENSSPADKVLLELIREIETFKEKQKSRGFIYRLFRGNDNTVSSEELKVMESAMSAMVNKKEETKKSKDFTDLLNTFENTTAAFSNPKKYRQRKNGLRDIFSRNIKALYRAYFKTAVSTKTENPAEYMAVFDDKTVNDSNGLEKLFGLKSLTEKERTDFASAVRQGLDIKKVKKEQGSKKGLNGLKSLFTTIFGKLITASSRGPGQSKIIGVAQEKLESLEQKNQTLQTNERHLKAVQTALEKLTLGIKSGNELSEPDAQEIRAGEKALKALIGFLASNDSDAMFSDDYMAKQKDDVQSKWESLRDLVFTIAYKTDTDDKTRNSYREKLLQYVELFPQNGAIYKDVRLAKKVLDEQFFKKLHEVVRRIDLNGTTKNTSIHRLIQERSPLLENIFKQINAADLHTGRNAKSTGTLDEVEQAIKAFLSPTYRRRRVLTSADMRVVFIFGAQEQKEIAFAKWLDQLGQIIKTATSNVDEITQHISLLRSEVSVLKSEDGNVESDDVASTSSRKTTDPRFGFLVEINGQQKESLTRLVESLITNEKYEEAHIVATNFKLVKSLESLVDSLIDAGNYVKAEEIAQALVSETFKPSESFQPPNDFEPTSSLKKLAEGLINAKRYNDAERVAKQLAEKFDQKDSLRLLVENLIIKAEVQKYEKVYELDAQYDLKSPWEEYANKLIDAGKFDKAYEIASHFKLVRPLESLVKNLAATKVKRYADAKRIAEELASEAFKQSDDFTPPSDFKPKASLEFLVEHLIADGQYDEAHELDTGYDLGTSWELHANALITNENHSGAYQIALKHKLIEPLQRLFTVYIGNENYSEAEKVADKLASQDFKQTENFTPPSDFEPTTSLEVLCKHLGLQKSSEHKQQAWRIAEKLAKDFSSPESLEWLANATITTAETSQINEEDILLVYRKAEQHSLPKVMKLLVGNLTLNDLKDSSEGSKYQRTVNAALKHNLIEPLKLLVQKLIDNKLYDKAQEVAEKIFSEFEQSTDSLKLLVEKLITDNEFVKAYNIVNKEVYNEHKLLSAESSTSLVEGLINAKRYDEARNLAENLDLKGTEQVTTHRRQRAGSVKKRRRKPKRVVDINEEYVHKTASVVSEQDNSTDSTQPKGSFATIVTQMKVGATTAVASAASTAFSAVTTTKSQKPAESEETSATTAKLKESAAASAPAPAPVLVSTTRRRKRKGRKSRRPTNTTKAGSPKMRRRRGSHSSNKEVAKNVTTRTINFEYTDLIDEIKKANELILKVKQIIREPKLGSDQKQLLEKFKQAHAKRKNNHVVRCVFNNYLNHDVQQILSDISQLVNVFIQEASPASEKEQSESISNPESLNWLINVVELYRAISGQARYPVPENFANQLDYSETKSSHWLRLDTLGSESSGLNEKTIPIFSAKIKPQFYLIQVFGDEKSKQCLKARLEMLVYHYSKNSESLPKTTKTVIAQTVLPYLEMLRDMKSSASKEKAGSNSDHVGRCESLLADKKSSETLVYEFLLFADNVISKELNRHIKSKSKQISKEELETLQTPFEKLLDGKIDDIGVQYSEQANLKFLEDFVISVKNIMGMISIGNPSFSTMEYHISELNKSISVYKSTTPITGNQDTADSAEEDHFKQLKTLGAKALEQATFLSAATGVEDGKERVILNYLKVGKITEALTQIKQSATDIQFSEQFKCELNKILENKIRQFKNPDLDLAEVKNLDEFFEQFAKSKLLNAANTEVQTFVNNLNKNRNFVSRCLKVVEALKQNVGVQVNTELGGNDLAEMTEILSNTPGILKLATAIGRMKQLAADKNNLTKQAINILTPALDRVINVALADSQQQSVAQLHKAVVAFNQRLKLHNAFLSFLKQAAEAKSKKPQSPKHRKHKTTASSLSSNVAYLEPMLLKLKQQSSSKELQGVIPTLIHKILDKVAAAESFSDKREFFDNNHDVIRALAEGFNTEKNGLLQKFEGLYVDYQRKFKAADGLYKALNVVLASFSDRNLNLLEKVKNLNALFNKFPELITQIAEYSSDKERKVGTTLSNFNKLINYFNKNINRLIEQSVTNNDGKEILLAFTQLTITLQKQLPILQKSLQSTDNVTDVTNVAELISETAYNKIKHELEQASHNKGAPLNKVLIENCLTLLTTFGTKEYQEKVCSEFLSILEDKSNKQQKSDTPTQDPQSLIRTDLPVNGQRQSVRERLTSWTAGTTVKASGLLHKTTNTFSMFSNNAQNQTSPEVKKYLTELVLKSKSLLVKATETLPPPINDTSRPVRAKAILREKIKALTAHSSPTMTTITTTTATTSPSSSTSPIPTPKSAAS